eukprot:TRINITY_DN3646_c0_g1_i1.p1 TRINITY_DN3646_c0_g1~~TRINITY_DN3646_c0_g1_i1.p1  ORF type:complete len:162 (+),score=26.89 TRINITY_DN3646_c0_g1_i1:63-548(+)
MQVASLWFVFYSAMVASVAAKDSSASNGTLSSFDTWYNHGQETCAGNWQQCGGGGKKAYNQWGGYKGTKACCEGYECKNFNSWQAWFSGADWKMCVPKSRPYSVGGDAVTLGSAPNDQSLAFTVVPALIFAALVALMSFTAIRLRAPAQLPAYVQRPPSEV